MQGFFMFRRHQPRLPGSKGLYRFLCSAETESVKDLSYGCMIVVVLGDIISFSFKIVIGIAYRASDSGGPDHRKVIFSVSCGDGIPDGDLIMLCNETQGCALVDSGRNDLQQIGIGIKTVQLAGERRLKQPAELCDAGGLVIIQTQQLDRGLHAERTYIVSKDCIQLLNGEIFAQMMIVCLGDNGAVCIGLDMDTILTCQIEGAVHKIEGYSLLKEDFFGVCIEDETSVVACDKHVFSSVQAKILHQPGGALQSASGGDGDDIVHIQKALKREEILAAERLVCIDKGIIYVGKQYHSVFVIIIHIAVPYKAYRFLYGSGIVISVASV